MKKRIEKFLITCAIAICLIIPTLKVSAEDSAVDVNVLDSGAIAMYATSIADYRDTKVDGNYTETPDAPEGYAGWLFAGWYEEKTCETALGEGDTTGEAWAKFVPADVLSVKAQISESTTYSSNTANIRFVSTIDTLDYKAVGFDFVINGNERETGDFTTVYEKLYAVDDNEEVIGCSPKEFHSMSEYFMTWTVRNVPWKAFGQGMSAQPYWITADGTKVYGVEGTKTVNMGYMPVVIEATMEQVGSIAYPGYSDGFSTLFDLGVCSQGGCIADKYYYQAVVNRTPGYDASTGEYDETKNEVIIQKYEWSETENKWILNSQSDVFKSLNHANDMTYNSKLKVLVICNNTGNRKRISFVDPTDWELKSPGDLGFKTIEGSVTVYDTYIELDAEIYSIDYNEYTDRYVVGRSGNNGFWLFDSNFQDLNIKWTSNTNTSGFTTQGISSDDAYIYCVLFNKNGAVEGLNGHVIDVYDWDGNLVTTIDIPNDSSTGITTSLEPENISVYNNEIYVACNEGSSTPIYKVKGLTQMNPEASIGEKKYATLADAVSAAEDGDLIQVLKDISITSTIKIEKALTITNRSSKDVTMYVNKTIQVAEAGTLSISCHENGGVLTLDARTMEYAQAEETKNSPATDTTARVILNNGTFNMGAGVTIQYVNYANEGGALYNNSNATANLAGDFKYNTAREGAAIFNKGTKVAINGGVYEGNSATGGSKGGGAIYNISVLEIKDSSFKNNTAEMYAGGAIYNTGTLTIAGSSFEGNVTNTASVTITNEDETTTTTEVGQGGAIYNAGTLTVEDNSSFKDNYAKTHGGAIYNNGTLTVDNTVFAENKTGSKDGGAIFNKSSKANTVTNATFTSNISARHGGAVTNDGSSALAVSGCTFNGNSASSLGEAIMNHSSGTLTLRDTFFENNGDGVTDDSVCDNGGTINVSGAITGAHIVFNTNSTKVVISKTGFDVENSILTIKPKTYATGQVVLYAEDDTDEAKEALADAAEMISVTQKTGDWWEIDSEGKLCAIATVGSSTDVATYTSLSDAVTGVESGSTIYVIDDFTMSAVTVSKNITIKNAPGVDATIYGSGTITISSGITFGIYCHEGGGKLTIDARPMEYAKADATKDSVSTSTTGRKILNNGTFNMGEGVTIQYIYYGNEGGALYNQNGATANLAGDFKYNTAREGAAIFNNSTATLAINGGTYANNTVTVTSGQKGGGAICNVSTNTVSIKNATFRNNSASKYNGGAIYNGGSSGTLNVEGCTFENNSVVDNSNGLGGAIYNATGKTLNTINCDFDNNTARRGGAIYNISDAIITVTGGTFTSNKTNIANSSGKYNDGGAISNNSASTSNSISGAIFRENYSSRNGGAIANQDNSAYLKITNCGFEGNTCASSGGAIVNHSNATLNILNTYFVGNTEGSYEGITGLFNASGTINLTNVTNPALVTSVDELTTAISSITDEGVIYLANDIKLTAAISTTSGTEVTIKPYALAETETVYLYGKKTITNNGTLTIECNGEKALVIDGRSDLTATTSDSGNSRLIMNNSGCTLTIQAGVTVQYGNRTDEGGGLYNFGTAYLSCDFKNNEARGGGAIYNASGSTLVITGGTYENNRTHTYNDETGDGGAIRNDSSSTSNLIAGATFINNYSERNGGAIANQRSGAYLVINNCGFEGNTCASSGGAIVNHSDTTLSIENTYFVGNTKSSTGYENTGIYNNGTISKYDNVTTEKPE